ncbi:MAG: hypothetical protein ACOCV2_14095 [Persicimonas sp.]
MSSSARWTTGIIFVITATLYAGCVGVPPTRSMVNADFVGDRTAKYMLMEPGKSAEQEGVETAAKVMGADVNESKVFHFVVRLCDMEDQREVNCKDTTVLHNVDTDPNPEENEGEEMDADRRITDIFWYDPDTLYVSYIEAPSVGDDGDEMGLTMMVPQPKVTMCRTEQDNTMRCSEQERIAEMLQVQE